MKPKALVLFQTLALFSIAIVGLAQSPSVPSEYQDLYSQLQGRLNAFDATVASSWNGSTFSAYFSAELSVASGNRGEQLLQPSALTGALEQLHLLRSLGARAVVIAIPYPILNRTYLNSIGRGSDYDQYLSYYKSLASEIYNRGMLMVVENGPMFPGTYSANSGYDVAAHYSAISDQDYIAARAAMAGVIASEIKPDYLQLGAEPDTEAELSGKTTLNSVSGYAGMISAMAAQARTAGTHSMEIGAGVGTWLPNGNDYISAYAQAGVSFIDLHIYPVNGDYLDNAITYADTARSLGKKVTICEAWLLKERDSELGSTSPAVDPTVFSRDAFSFWAPLDQQFLSGLVNFAHWKQLSLVSAFWSQYLFAYLDYASESGKTPSEIVSDSQVAAARAIGAGQVSETGGAYHTDNSTGTFALSNSSYAGDRAAASEIISVFGTHLSNSPEMTTSSPAASLGGTSAIVTDRNGTQSPALLYSTSFGLVNLVLSSGLAEGQAILQVTSGDGIVSNASLQIAPVAPGISAANANGYGSPAALIETIAADGTVSINYPYDCSSETCVPTPIDVSGGNSTYLVLFGTGIRNRSSLDQVVTTIGGVSVTAAYAGAQPQYPGLDQINLLLPHSLAGLGAVILYMTVDGIPSNRMMLSFL